jgi:hypothetical protein
VTEEDTTKPQPPNGLPAYWYKHPCVACGDGYKFCLQWLSMNMQCCKECDHPGRYETNPPYTPAEIEHMQQEWAKKKGR